MNFSQNYTDKTDHGAKVNQHLVYDHADKQEVFSNITENTDLEAKSNFSMLPSDKSK